MAIAVIDILITIRTRKNTIAQQNQTWELDKNTQRKKLLQKQMFILMVGSVCIFLTTTLPVGIYKIISPQNPNLGQAVLSIVTIWTGLGWFQSLLYAVSKINSSFFLDSMIISSDFLFRLVSTYIV